MEFAVESYLTQRTRWPETGRHILAQYDAECVVVYQAYSPSIGQAAVAEQRFGGGGWSLGRMSWIKPNFLWMMYRCGWGTKPGQEVVLAVYLRRAAFDEILRLAVHSAYVPEVHATWEAWKRAVNESNVRLQWDPDHSPSGEALERRAIQLGLRGPVLAAYANDWIVKIEDISEFVREQRQYVTAGSSCAAHRYSQLMTPREVVYAVTDAALATRLQLSIPET